MRRLPFLARDRSGNIAISAALSMPLLIGALALGIDYGSLTLQQRDLQSTADLAAIAAAGNLSNPEKGALDFFTLNNRDIPVRTTNGLLTSKGLVPFDPNTVLMNYGTYAEVTKGRYTPDPSLAAANRFVAGATPSDSMRLTLRTKGALYFSGSMMAPPQLAASGTASIDKSASFSIGSRLASLNEGVLNALLGQLLGTTISLKVMDYQGLVDTQVDLLKTLDALAIDLNLQAGTYEDLLKTDITYGKLFTTLAKTTGLSPSVATVLNTLGKAVDKTKVTLKLQDILSPGPLSKKLIGQSDGLTINTNLMDLVSAAATANQDGKQLAVDVGAAIPGLGSAKLTIAIGEPPAGTPYLAAGAPGTIVRTAQTRIAAEVTLDGVLSLLGFKVRVPVYLEIANAEAKLVSITCPSAGKNTATVDIDAVPGVAELTLGDVDTSAFANFGTKPRATKADLVTSPLLDVTALVYGNATNSKPSRLTFTPSDITTGKVRSVSTQDTITTLFNSLLGNLELQVELLNIPLGVPKLITAALQATLPLVTAPLDTLLTNTLLALGIRIGEADVRLGGTVCRNPVLVQ